MNQDDPPPEYTPIPFPPPKSTQPVSPKPRSGSSIGAGFGKVRSGMAGFRKKHPVISYGAAVICVLAMVVAIAGIIYVAPFSKKADEFDLSQMTSLEVGSLALDRKGNSIGRISMQDRLLVRLPQVPNHLVDALVATEDNRFFEHQGFDLRGMARATVQNLKAGSVKQGASTITQQLARHAFSLEGRTFDRKFTEIFLANRIEGAYSKNEILESYFNRIYLGSGFWGVGSAARGYFGKEIEDLTVSESATLCALIKSPNRFSPFRNADASVAARNRTLSKMAELGMISQTEFEKLAAEPNVALGDSKRSERPHFLLTRIREEALKALPNRTGYDSLVIETSIDLQIQAKTMTIVDDLLKLVESRENWNHPRPWGKSSPNTSTTGKASPFLQAAVVAIENRTGKIVTAIGGRNFRESQFNRAWQSKRQPGSAFLPFLYAAAYESEKISPITTLMDAPMDNKRIMIGGQTGILGEWSTESTEEKFEGNISAAYALTKSKNSPAARMALEKMTPESMAGFAKNLGLSGQYEDYPSVFLGTTPTNLIDLVKAYSAFPNGGGIPNQAKLITRITSQDGTVLYEAPQEFQTTVFSEETAAAVHASLSSTFTNGTAQPWLPEASRLRSKVAGKSGTSYGFTDNWFIGYNAEYSWGVWLGFDTPKMIYDEAFGSDTALPIWIEMAKLLETNQTLPFGRVSSLTRNVCLKTGCLAGDHCPVITVPFSSATKRPLFDKDTPLCPEHKIADPSLTESSSAIRARPISRAIVPAIPVVTGPDPYQSMNPNQTIQVE